LIRPEPSYNEYPFLSELGLKETNSAACAGPDSWADTDGRKLVDVSTPINGSVIARVAVPTEADYDRVVDCAKDGFLKWRLVPAPERGQVVREIADEVRKFKEPLGKLITLEMGKIFAEATGEVQEAIDIADFSVGLSRQLYGLTMQSERRSHRMYEQWHPLGVVGIVTAFNFPIAVWSWNAMIAAVCGDTMVWKPSSKTPLTSIAVQHILNGVLGKRGLTGIFTLVAGSGSVIGERLINDRRIQLVSVTGSTRMGRHVAEVTARRMARSILELGGNNAVIVAEDANLDLAVQAILFGAVGTAGQRCTSTRRIIAHRKIIDELTRKLVGLYEQVRIGNPLKPETMMGPLVDGEAVSAMMRVLESLPREGGVVVAGGRKVEGPGFYVTPSIVRVDGNTSLVREETFAPILYVIPYDTLEQAIKLQNDVPQGLSSAIFTESIKNAEHFLSAGGSDCGIANVNIGTSGAEIGGAFGGEKESGGGREAGSDAWKLYMRRQTTTINWSSELPLAQGVRFGT
jgi:aldehyde dehydrogenase (NAD+)